MIIQRKSQQLDSVGVTIRKKSSQILSSLRKLYAQRKISEQLIHQFENHSKYCLIKSFQHQSALAQNIQLKKHRQHIEYKYQLLQKQCQKERQNVKSMVSNIRKLKWQKELFYFKHKQCNLNIITNKNQIIVDADKDKQLEKHITEKKQLKKQISMLKEKLYILLNQINKLKKVQKSNQQQIKALRLLFGYIEKEQSQRNIPIKIYAKDQEDSDQSESENRSIQSYNSEYQLEDLLAYNSNKLINQMNNKLDSI